MSSVGSTGAYKTYTNVLKHMLGSKEVKIPSGENKDLNADICIYISYAMYIFHNLAV